MQMFDNNNTSDVVSRQSGVSSGRRRVALAPHEGEIKDWVDEGRSDEWIASALGTSPASIQSFRSRKGISRTARREPARREPARREPPEKPERRSRTSPVSLYEGTLEHGEEGYGLWLDPAVADDPIFQRGFARVNDVEVSVQKERIVLTPMPGSRTEVPDEQAAPAEDGASRLEMVFGASARQAAATEPGKEQGSVKWYDLDKGYGFIFRPSGREIFFHKTAIKGAGTLEAGTEVSYEVGENERGPVATGVRKRG